MWRWPPLPRSGWPVYGFRLYRMATLATDFGAADRRSLTSENQPLRHVAQALQCVNPIPATARLAETIALGSNWRRLSWRLVDSAD
ncbi:MAG: hypothetical protein KDA72_16515 [Planctomycetales bacterium]|nr:hypothetical protein [Planctomycetales bacterium]